MKLTKLFAILFVLALALFAGNDPPSGIDAHCGSFSTDPVASSCPVGEVLFTGTDYPHNVMITVTGLNAGQVDAENITCPHGELSVPEPLGTADTWTIEVFDQKGVMIATGSVTTF